MEELEVNTKHAFKYISQIEAYVKKKISSLVKALEEARANLRQVYREITKWKDLNYSLKNNTVTILVYASSSNISSSSFFAQS